MFTNDEINLMCIYDIRTREGLITELTQTRNYLDMEETELLALTDSALDKLRRISDAEYAAANLFPDFDDTTQWMNG